MRKAVLLLGACLLCGLQAGAQINCALSSNVIDIADYGTMNLEVSYALARHWTVSAGAKYNPFTYSDDAGNRLQRRQRLLAVGARWWPWHVWSGWWLSAKWQYQEYNTGGGSELLTSEGDRLGGGLGAGYAWMLSPRLNLDFGLGGWAGYGWTTTYACPRCGRITSSGKGFFLLPNDLLLSLTYIF